MSQTPMLLPRALRSTPPAEAPANDVELRGPLEDRALMRSEYQRIR